MDYRHKHTSEEGCAIPTIMFAEPTCDLFKSWIGHHLAKASTETAEAIALVKAKMNAAGAYRSGRMFLQIFAQVDVGLERLGYCARRVEARHPDHEAAAGELRRITEHELRAFVDGLKGISNATELRSWCAPKSVDDRIAKLDRDLQFALDHFDAGFLDPAEPELPAAMTNTINIGSMSNSAIQQGTSHSSFSSN